MKRSSLQRRTPMKRKRAAPRRDEGRVQHQRTKRHASDPPTVIEQAHMDRLRARRCLVPGCTRTSIIHHLMKAPGKRCRRDHRFVANLCPHHHNMGDDSVHLLGSEEGFREVHGIDLVAYALAEWAWSEQHLTG